MGLAIPPWDCGQLERLELDQPQLSTGLSTLRASKAISSTPIQTSSNPIWGYSTSEPTVQVKGILLGTACGNKLTELLPPVEAVAVTHKLLDY